VERFSKLSEPELGAYKRLRELWIAWSGMPRLHPSEGVETSRIFNDLQNRLLERPGLRANLWPEPPDWNQLSSLEQEEVTALVRKNLEELGTTPAELAAWYALGNAAGNICGLPELHPMQKEECVHTFHKLQARLLARLRLRAAGRETRTPDSNTIPNTIVRRERLAAAGMTNKEIEAWESLARAADHIYQLPEVYPGEHRESQQDCHDIELRLLARPALRAVLDE